MHQKPCLLLAAAACLSLAACGDDPVNYSQPVTINLKAKSSDTTNNVVDDEKNITTESGNPFGKFVADARTELGGADPSTIELDATTITLGAASTGVLGLGEVFTGNVEVTFTIDDTNNTFIAASGPVVATDGSGPIELTSAFTTEGKAAADVAKILGASFRVGIRGPAATGFVNKGADADLQVTLTFTAFE